MPYRISTCFAWAYWVFSRKSRSAAGVLVLGDLDCALGAHEHRVARRVGARGRHQVDDHVAPVVVAELEDLRGDQLALAVPAALAGVDQRSHDGTENVTGSEVRFPFEDMGMWVTSPASSHVAIRRASTPRTSAISIRASCAPRQACGPNPNV